MAEEILHSGFLNITFTQFQEVKFLLFVRKKINEKYKFLLKVIT